MEQKPTEHHQEEALLKKIRSKEEEIEKSISELRKSSAKKIEDVRCQTQEEVQKAEVKAQEEARQYEALRKKAFALSNDKILSDAKNQAEIIREKASKNFDSALNMILSQVLPRSEEKNLQKTKVTLGVA
ncbi:MAG: hypothetical protein HYS07_07080 [Chlamydiae bacterium]|nr:hypothetical protein [Chlamydiota bacterium]MBI3276906.1 hypothetical protein [Chlamydiota bacterium]